MTWATPHFELRHQSCVVCGAPIADEHAYLADLRDHDSGAHTECVDWSNREFPFTGLVTALVRCRRAAVGVQKAAWFMLSRRLWLLQREWPLECPAAVRRIRDIEKEARQLARLQNFPQKLHALI